MRISDWSSDVCSSDLQAPVRSDRQMRADYGRRAGHRPHARRRAAVRRHNDCHQIAQGHVRKTARETSARVALKLIATRSEEHTSELQSLMRISYAVFCLKKQKIKKTTHQITIVQSYATNNIT